jgi:hypothetical protein
VTSENSLVPIGLYCEYSSAPGLSWSSEIKFLPAAGENYVIWNNSKSSEFESDGEKLVGIISDVSWRGIAAWLRSYEGGLGGEELFDEIRVYGLDSYAADIVAMCWISLYNQYGDVLDFLLSRSDADLAILHRLDGDYRTVDWFYHVREFMEFMEEIGMSHLAIGDVLKEYGLQDRPESTNLLDDLRDEVYKAQERESRSKEIQDAIQNFIKYESERYGSAELTMQCERLREYLVKWTQDLEFGFSPLRGIVEITPLGSIDLDLLFDRVEGHVRRVNGHLLDKATMEHCAQYSSPRPGPEMLFLLESWVAAEVKPQVSGEESPPVDMASEAEFVMWLFGYLSDDVAQYAAHHAPDAYQRILNWVVERQVRPFTVPTTWAGGYGVCRRRKPWSRWEAFVKQLQGASDGTET